MTNLDKKIYSQILDPDFDVTQLDFDACVGLASEIVGSRELYQKMIGKIALELSRKYPTKRVADFADAISETSGYKVSKASVLTYKWVYEKLESIAPLIPQDFNYSAWRLLAGTEDPKSWLTRATEGGWSGQELSFHIKGGKKVNKKTCKVCGAPV